jgi:hypothetical protein
MSKYDALGAYLRGQGADLVPMTFAEIERVVGAKLPKSQKHQAWWSNSTSNNVMTQVWLDAGYRSEQVDVAGRKLVFRRAANIASGMQEELSVFKSAPNFAPPAKKVDRHPAIGAMKGMFTIEPGYDLAQSPFSQEELNEMEANLDRTADMIEAGLKKKP